MTLKFAIALAGLLLSLSACVADRYGGGFPHSGYNQIAYPHEYGHPSRAG